MSITDGNLSSEYLRVVMSRFQEMKSTSEKAFEQVDQEALFWVPNEESNSIAVIVKHMSGNMISRWTDFLHSNGEKANRNRDAEFENTLTNREELLEVWNKGWSVFFNALSSIKEDHLLKKVLIRNEPHTVLEAIERQMYHYSYHTGQIVYIAKQLSSDKWKSLTIPRKKK